MEINENFIASDCLAFSGKTNRVAYLPEKTVAFVSPKNFKFYNFNGNEIEVTVQSVNVDCGAFDLTGYKHFMLKEIYEQPAAVRNSKNFLNQVDIFDSCKISPRSLKSISIIGVWYILACSKNSTILF